MVDPATAITALGSALGLFRNALGLAREIKDSLPDNAKKQAIEESLVAAEKASKIAEAQLAQTLGYSLCQCAWPPNIMLQIPDSPDGQTHTKCPACGHVWPPFFREIKVETEL